MDILSAFLYLVYIVLGIYNFGLTFYIKKNLAMSMILWNLAKTCEVDSELSEHFENYNEAIKCV